MAHSDEVQQKESKNNEGAANPGVKKDISPAGWAAISAIAVAIVGCIGTLIGAALNPDLAQVILDKVVNSTPTATTASAVPNPKPNTTTPTTTPVKISPTDTPVLTWSAGEDWKSNCISTLNWQPDLENDTAEDNKGCHNLIPWGIAANNGGLLLTTVSNKNQSAKEYGIFTALSQRRSFKFSIRASELTNSEVWLGFFDECSLKSNGILVTIQNDDNFDVREMPSEKEYADNIHLGTQGGYYENILIEFVGPTLYVTVDGQPIVAGYPISVSPKHLFVGYRMLPKGEIKATIRDMEIH